MFQQLDHDLLRSQSTNFGKNTICCSVKGPFGLVDRTFEFVGTHNIYTKIADFINPAKFSTVQRMYTGAQFITPRTYTHTTRFLTLITISIDSYSCSQAHNSFWSVVTDRHNNRTSSAYNIMNLPILLFCNLAISSTGTETKQNPV